MEKTMGEYANVNGSYTKIGTCENMYYLRYEDRMKVSPVSGNIDPRTRLNLRWRLPFPDEDEVQIGYYEPYLRGIRLSRFVKSHIPIYDGYEDYYDESLADATGLIQVHHECGLLVNLPCYHGIKLPDNTKEVKFHWNGKSHSLELVMVKNTETGVRPVIRCKHCNTQWISTWDEIMEYVLDKKLRERLEIYR
jgi:hypothetical protein